MRVPARPAGNNLHPAGFPLTEATLEIIALSLALEASPQLHLARFPGCGDACYQAEQCRQALDDLARCRYLHGHADGLWDALAEDARFDLDYWLLLWGAHTGGCPRVSLDALKAHVGAERFLAGWRPPDRWRPPRRLMGE